MRTVNRILLNDYPWLQRQSRLVQNFGLPQIGTEGKMAPCMPCLHKILPIIKVKFKTKFHRNIFFLKPTSFWRWKCTIWHEVRSWTDVEGSSIYIDFSYIVDLVQCNNRSFLEMKTIKWSVCIIKHTEITCDNLLLWLITRQGWPISECLFAFSHLLLLITMEPNELFANMDIPWNRRSKIRRHYSNVDVGSQFLMRNIYSLHRWHNPWTRNLISHSLWEQDVIPKRWCLQFRYKSTSKQYFSTNFCKILAIRCHNI